MQKLAGTVITLGVTALLAGCSPAANQSAQTVDKVESTAATPTAQSTQTTLPPHTVASDTDISGAAGIRRRIEIHVTDPKLSKEDCLRLIAAYADRAGSTGQVGVWKPDQAGVLQPWGVDNMDGTPVIFNDELFNVPPPEPPKPAPKNATAAERHYAARDNYLTYDIMTSWTRSQVEAAFKKDGGRATGEVWPLGKDGGWVEIKYTFSDNSWLFVGYAEDLENLGGSVNAWRMQDIFPPGETR